METATITKGQNVVTVLNKGEYETELRIHGVNGSISLFYWQEVTAEELESLGEFTAMVTDFYAAVSKRLQEK